MKYFLFLTLLPLLFIGCQEYDDNTLNIDLITLNVFDINQNEINEDEVIGDGETILLLIAKIPSDVRDEFKSITFKASRGSFLGTSSDNSVVKVDNNGEAKARFRVPLDEGTLFISAEIGSGTDLQKDDISFELIGVKEIVTLEVFDFNGEELSSIIRADGNTVLSLVASVNYGQDRLNQVTFMNSGGGKFLGVNATEAIININDENVATLQYEVPNAIGRIFFSASVGESNAIFDDLYLDLERAYPNTIILEPSAVSIEVDKSIALNAFLRRETGKVSVGTTTSFEAFQLDDTDMEETAGRFTGLAEAVTDSEGKVSVTFFADSPNIDTMKPITIRVTSQNDSGDVIVETVDLQVKEVEE